MIDRKNIREAVDEIDFYRHRYSVKERIKRFVLPVVFLIIVMAIGAGVLSGIENEKIMQTWAKVQYGDVLYADSSFVVDSNKTQLQTYRLIRPWNKADIVALDTPEWIKLKLITQLDTSEEAIKPFMIRSNLLFTQESMWKNKSLALGEYLNRDSTTAEWLPDTVKLTPSPEKWYAIKPYMKLADTNYIMKVPPKYLFADEYYYIHPFDATLLEPNIFKNKLKL